MVLPREPQAVRLRQVLSCEWTFEGEPKRVFRSRLRRGAPVILGGAYVSTQKAEACAFGVFFKQGGTTAMFVPLSFG